MSTRWRRHALALIAWGGVTVALTAQAPSPLGSAPQRFTVTAEGHPLAVWARVPSLPRAAILLIHGRTWSSRPDFDLQPPGLKRSVLQSLSDRGIAAYALDLRGYGETPRDPSGYTTPRRAAADITATLKWIASRHPSLDTPALLGWSNGAAMALITAITQPDALSSVTLFGFTPDVSYHIAPTPVLAPAPKTRNTAGAAASDFIAPAVTPPAVVRAFVAAALAADPIYAEWKNDDELNLMDASKLTVPVLLLHGEKDPGTSTEDAGKFLAAVASHAKSYVVLPLADHCAQLEDTHEAFVSAVAEFITRARLR